MEMENVADMNDHVTCETIQDAIETQLQTIEVDINVAYAGVVPVQESQQKDKQSATAAPKIATSTNFQFQGTNNNPITEENIAYGVIPWKEAQEKQQNEQLGIAPQTATLETNDQFPEYNYPTTEQGTSEAVYDNPDFEPTPKSAAVSAAASVDDHSPYYK